MNAINHPMPADTLEQQQSPPAQSPPLLTVVDAQQSESAFTVKALKLAEHFPVFPCGPNKKPFAGTHGFLDATQDPEQIRKWGIVYPDALIGVPTGSTTGIGVVDLDVDTDPETGEHIDGFATLRAIPGVTLPPCRKHKTTRGEHNLFSIPKGVTLKSTAGDIGPGVDTRGEGGYIIWWPAEGKAVENPKMVTLLPDWVPALLNAPKPAKGATGGAAVTYTKGSRNNALASVAGTMRSVGLDAAAINAALQLFNLASCNPSLPVEEVATIAQSVGRYAPDRPPADTGEMFGAVPAAAQSGDEWPEPREIPEHLIPVAPFDHDLLPSPFAPFVKDVAGRKSWPADFLSVGLMVVAATLVGRKVVLQPYANDPSWQMTPNLLGLYIGPPGMMAKTPAADTAMGFLKPFITNAEDIYKGQVQTYHSRRAYHEAKVSALESKRNKELREGSEDDAQQTHYEIDILKEKFKESQPKQKRYYTSDTSAEALFDVLRDNPQGVCLYPDEITRLLRQMEQDNYAMLRGMFLTAANGNSPYVRDRRSEAKYNESAILCLSALGGIQPGMLRMMIGNSREGGEGDDGLPQRFGMMVWPDPVSAKDDRSPPDLLAQAEVARVMERLDAILMNDKPSVFLFDADAENAFREWYCRQTNEIETGIIDAGAASYVSKHPKLIGSIALLTAIIERRNTVTLADWRKARLWQGYLLSHLKRIHHHATQPTDDYARNIINKFGKGELIVPNSNPPYTTARELQHSRVPGADTSKAATELLGWLEELGYVRLAPRGTIKGTKEAWFINPKVLQQKV